MKRIDKDILNLKLVEVLNDTLKLLDVTYKNIVDELDYSDDTYMNRVFRGKKAISIATLVNLSNAFISIKNRKKLNINEEKLKASYFLSKIGY